jgi:hypothetical protein
MAEVKDYNEIMSIDNFISDDECRFAMSEIDGLIDMGLTDEVNHYTGREDECLNIQTVGARRSLGTFAVAMLKRFYQEALPDYVQRFPVLATKKLGIMEGKAQRTRVTGGFHNWHYEAFSGISSDRVLTYTLYLNDDFQGGETEFLYQGVRVEPKMGRFCLFPCSFLHTHRGNPPLKGTKYILTGWVNDLDPYEEQAQHLYEPSPSFDR